MTCRQLTGSVGPLPSLMTSPAARPHPPAASCLCRPPFLPRARPAVMVIAQLILTDGTDCRRTADDVLVSNVRLLAGGTAA